MENWWSPLNWRKLVPYLICCPSQTNCQIKENFLTGGQIIKFICESTKMYSCSAAAALTTTYSQVWVKIRNFPHKFK